MMLSLIFFFFESSSWYYLLFLYTVIKDICRDFPFWQNEIQLGKSEGRIQKVFRNNISLTKIIWQRSISSWWDSYSMCSGFDITFFHACVRSEQPKSTNMYHTRSYVSYWSIYILVKEMYFSNCISFCQKGQSLHIPLIRMYRNSKWYHEWTRFEKRRKKLMTASFLIQIRTAH